MTKWQLMPILVGVVMVAAFVGISVSRRAGQSRVAGPDRPHAAEPQPPEKPADPAKEESGDQAPPRERKPEAPPNKPPAEPRAKSGLPVALEQLLKLTAAQEASIAKVMADWNAKLGEINQKTSKDMRTATKETLPTILTEWRQQFMALKGHRTDQLNQIFTSEQATTYRDYRDKQFQAWLDGKVNRYCTVARFAISATEDQIAQIKPLVRTAYEQVTSGGNLVPSDDQRRVVKQLLHQQMAPLLDASQAEKLTQNESAFDSLW